MGGKNLFERNLRALAPANPALADRLSAANAEGGRYRFLESRTGETIPALPAEGRAKPLHSTVDPAREAARLADAATEGFIVCLGLGAGFVPAALLAKSGTRRVVAIEYDAAGLAELLSARDYAALFSDPRFILLCDAVPGEIEKTLLECFRPSLDGGIRVLPLLPRTEGDGNFRKAGEAIQAAIAAVTRDYSVQSWFGKRWFSNIVRNIPAAETADYPLPGIQKAAIAAAGPSLEKSFSALKKLVGEGTFVVACDTAYPVLRGAGIEPAGVLSIDCQYLSSFHFVGAVPENAWLFMGLSSPPTLGHLAKKTAFLSGGHPLEQYVRRAWRNLPALDTSGANVAYAAYSLAESLGAQEIEMFGADFSYPCGKAYARGSYLYRYFAKYASRLAPVEAQHSALLYRAPLEKSDEGETWKYETATLRFYREKLAEKKAHHAPAAAFIAPARAAASAREFLSTYKNEIEELSSFDEEGEGIKNIISTILPTAASFRRENPSCGVDELFAMTKEWCVSEISRVLASIE